VGVGVRVCLAFIFPINPVDRGGAILWLGGGFPPLKKKKIKKKKKLKIKKN